MSVASYMMNLIAHNSCSMDSLMSAAAAAIVVIGDLNVAIPMLLHCYCIQ